MAFILLYVTSLCIIFLQNITLALFLQERGLNSTLLIVVFIEFTMGFHEKGEKKSFSPGIVSLSLSLLEFNKSTKHKLKSISL